MLKCGDIIIVIILYNSNSFAIMFTSLTFLESSKKQEKEAGFSVNLLSLTVSVKKFWNSWKPMCLNQWKSYNFLPTGKFNNV